jgi:hypothetical protein
MRGLAVTCLLLGLTGAFLTAASVPARADWDDWHHHWHHRWYDHDHWRWREPPYYWGPPRYYAPPPAYYPPPPAYYAPPPVYYGPPGATFSFGIR